MGRRTGRRHGIGRCCAGVVGHGGFAPVGGALVEGGWDPASVAAAQLELRGPYRTGKTAETGKAAETGIKAKASETCKRKAVRAGVRRDARSAPNSVARGLAAGGDRPRNGVGGLKGVKGRLARQHGAILLKQALAMACLQWPACSVRHASAARRLRPSIGPGITSRFGLITASQGFDPKPYRAMAPTTRN